MQGPKGDQGIQGPPGVDGKPSYTHIAYADSADGTKNFSVSDPDRDYIGMYVDSTATDSTTPSKYKWSKIKGADGSQGVPGKPGANGKTPYLHIAYANSADGRTGFSTTVSTNKLYIGQYTDYTAADSTDPTKYAWTKIKGDPGQDGADGQDGKDGTEIQSITAEYYLSTSKDKPTGGSWSSVPPEWENGKYIWTRNKIVYRNPDRVEYTTPVCDSSWEAVNDIEIGGRNILLYTDDPINRFDTYGGSTLSQEYDSVSGWNTEKVVRLYGTGGTSSICVLYNRRLYVMSIEGRRYVTSVFIKNNHPTNVIRVTANIKTQLSDTVVVSPGETKRAVIFSKSLGTSGVQINFTTDVAGKDFDFSVWHMQIEEGNVVTDWSPSPEETTSMYYATSSSPETSASKAASTSRRSLILKTGVTVAVKFNYPNTASNPTLNVDNTGAKAIYTQGVRYAYWAAGATVIFTYDGSYWRVCSEPVYASTATIGNPGGYHVYIDGDSLDIMQGSKKVASFSGNGVMITGNSGDQTFAFDGKSLSVYPNNDFGTLGQVSFTVDGNGIISFERQPKVQNYPIPYFKDYEIALSNESVLIASNARADLKVNFDQSHSSAPDVVLATPYTSTGGGVHVAVKNFTKTGFTANMKNDGSTNAYFKVCYMAIWL